MRIVDVKVHILEDPDRTLIAQELVQVPNLRRIQYTHRGRSTDATGVP